MVNPIRHYDWGSRTALAALQGRPPAATPEAELWMSAHPLASSQLLLDGGPHSLAEVIDADPAAVLGGESVARFGPRLPFLLKVLAVERALSVQVHPGTERARAGFAAQEAAGVALGSALRTFVDPHGKPEFLYALTPFLALAGFRDAQDAAALLRLVDLPVLAEILDVLGEPSGLAPDASGRNLAAQATAVLLRLPAPARTAFSAAAAARVGRLLANGADLSAAARDAMGVVIRLAEEHPGDVLVVAPLLMRLHALPPGGTIFLPTGVPHAYLGGTAVEVMAASDNVLRAGLTTKHVDAEELLAALDPRCDAVVGWRPDDGTAPDVTAWTVPAPDFSLARLLVRGPGSALPGGPAGPRIVLCTSGRIAVRCARHEVLLRAGASAFLPADAGQVVLEGAGEAFVAGPGPTIE